MQPIIPYCGVAPLPGATTWNVDPVLLACLALFCGAHLRSIRTEPRWRAIAAGSGWLVAMAALVSPLCNLSVALFSARVGQHMVLALVAAPLLALAIPARVRAPGGVWAPGAVFAIVLWAWHTPVLYDATFRSATVYWAMHLSMGGAAVWFWAALLDRRAHAFAAFGASFLTGLQMSLLGALLTFGARPWFPVHFGTTAPWGLSPLEDQQLGGLIMWVPAGLLLTGYAILMLGLELSRMSHADRASPRGALGSAGH
jgi:putative membrane protein